jgi:pantetheine-phosphate adenylyltransferase
MRIAVCPGSFDPVSFGHLDIIERASDLFDKVIVLVVVNPDKQPSFSAEERVDMLRAVTAGLKNVEVDSYCGLLIDYVRRAGAAAIVKGLRAMSDFEYEFQMALTNKKMYPQAETVFLTTSITNLYLSSSLIKQVARFNGDLSGLVPDALHDVIRARLSQNRKDGQP